MLRLALVNADPIEAMDNEEVFEARIHDSLTISSTALNTSCFTLIFSIIASITKSESVS